ncbi:MAG: restriction endonuclease subunit S [Methanosarcina sp.]
MEKKLPEGWKEYKIKDIGDVVTGSTPPKKDPENYGGVLPWIKPPDLDIDKFVSTSEETISETGRKKVRLLPKGSVLVSCIGNIGKVAIADTELCTNQQINSIIPDENIVVSDFLYYTIKKIRPYLENIASSAVVPLLNKTDFSNINIKLPPLETQKKIVSILEKAEETRKLRAQADELTQKLLQSVFLEMFGDLETNPKGWVVKSFDYFAKIDTKMVKEFTAYENKPHIGIENIEKDTGDLINYNEVGAQNLTSGKYIFTKEHIIYSKIRPNLNKVALPNFDGLCSADAYPLLVNKNHTNRYFFAYILRSKYFLDNILKLSDRTNIPKVNKDQLRSFECVCPPLELQNRFAEYVEHVEKTKKYQKQSSFEINNLFDALMQKAFTGELVA